MYKPDALLKLIKRPRSPFRGMSRGELRMYRKLTTAVVEWERHAAAERYYMLQTAWRILENDGGVYQARVLDEMESRALTRLRKLPNWGVIREQRRIEFMRQFNPKAYESFRLRQEVETLRAEVAELAGRETGWQ